MISGQIERVSTYDHNDHKIRTDFNEDVGVVLVQVIGGGQTQFVLLFFELKAGFEVKRIVEAKLQFEEGEIARSGR